MPEKQNEEFDFIREKIKNKPINKRRVAQQLIKTTVSAVFFGFVACLVFTWMRPIMEEWFYEQDEPVVKIPRDDGNLPMETETLQPETESEKAEPTETESEAVEPSTQIIEVPKELEIEDYQKLQDKLYAIGTQANKFIVTVTGVKSDMDWFDSPYETAGQSCGIVVANNGRELLVMTERKVIADAQAIRVTLYNGTVADAALKQYDGNTGIAILSVPLEALKESDLKNIETAQLGNSYRVSQGNVVIAVGSPLGSNYSILTGNITSINNTVSTIDSNFTVFTTNILGSQAGSGVLLNLKGEVIGLVMQDYSSKGEENTLTAFSISELKEIIEMLSNNQAISYLGLKVSTVTSEIEETYALPRGVYIKSVEMDSPALAAGLQSGDIITALDGNEISTVEQYEQYVRRLVPESNITITILRQGNGGYSEIKCQAEAGHL